MKVNVFDAKTSSFQCLGQIWAYFIMPKASPSPAGLAGRTGEICLGETLFQSLTSEPPKHALAANPPQEAARFLTQPP